MLARLDFGARSNAPNQCDRKGKVDPATQDRNRPHAPAALRTPTQPMATRTRSAVPGWIVNLPSLRPDVHGRLAATQKENDRNHESRPAEFRHAIDQS